jgi:uncharacterized protein YjbJ (UPF0337 family)
MSSDYNYFGEFTDDADDLLDQLEAKIQEGVDWVIQQWEDHMNSWKMKLELSVSPAIAYLAHQAVQKLEAALKELWDLFSDFVTDLWAKIDKMIGGPWALMQMSDYYTWASAHLRDEGTLVARMNDRLSEHWEGDARDAFGKVTAEQVAAINGVSDGLTAAAAACAGGADQLRSIWREVIKTVLTLAGNMLDCVKDGTDVGQWVTFDTGPALKLYGKIGVELLDLANTLESYFDENATVQHAMWADLNTGVDGMLAGNTWPNVEPSKQHDMDSKDDYVPL